MARAADTIERNLKNEPTDPAGPGSTSSSPPAKTRARDEVLVPARFEEIEAVHRMVTDAVETSPYYNDEFKAYEGARLTATYLAELLRTDPRHVMTIRENGELAGFILSGPEFGILWQYWSYLDPKHRSGTLAMRVMRNYQSVWQNDRFHKILTYSRPENKVSIALMERYGYKRVAELKQHLFGQDYLLYEYPLTKTRPGYDHGIGAGIRASLHYRIRQTLPFLFR
jgi:RimJ/RimL family protein N-acetyltransferase